MKKVRIIKIALWTMLILFIGYILYLMYVEPYTKNGSHYITVEECKETYNCDCTYDDGEMCLCTLKKWFMEKEYFCVREDISDNQIIKE